MTPPPLSPLSPQDVLMSLKAAARPQKQRNLDAIHAVCQELHKTGSRDFSFATVGRMAHERGGPSPRTMYTAQSQDFRTLVKAWKDFSEAADDKKTVPKVRSLAEDDLVRRIDDPALRALIAGIVAERNRLRSQINVLRANANVVIDRRPSTGSVHGTVDDPVVQVVAPKQLLTDIEREALERAISKQFLAQEGWREGDNGEIVNAKGRRIFEHGYATALRKLLR